LTFLQKTELREEKFNPEQEQQKLETISTELITKYAVGKQND